MSSTPPLRPLLGPRAQRDLRGIDRFERRRIAAALDELASGAENLDIKAVVGQPPWLRLRTGNWRVLYRPATQQETLDGIGWVIGRVINRRELERAIRTLS